MSEVDKKQDYWINAKGDMIHVDNIKDVDKLRNEIVLETVKRALMLSENLRHIKRQMLDDISAFVELSAEKYGVKMGGRKGNLTLMSFDGKYKVMFAISESIQFDERILAAKALIDECIHEWTQDSRGEIKALIENAFNVDKQGNLSTTKILSLRAIKIEDSRWIEAMNAIADSIQIVGSKSYIRIYERQNDDLYKQVALDIAAV